MRTESASVEREIDRVFTEARENGGYEFLYTLVRVDGMQCWDGYEDEFLQLRTRLTDPSLAPNLSHYQQLAGYTGPLKLLLNLMNCVRGQHYDVNPFRSLVKGSFPNAVPPTAEEIVEFSSSNLRSGGYPYLGHLVSSAYLLEQSGEISRSTADRIPAFEDLRLLLTQVLDRYYKELASAQKEPRYVPQPGSLDVLELLSDEKMGGLCGLKVHFSQGCSALFHRSLQGVIAQNIELGPPVVFLMMSTEPPGNEYRVDGKRLYEHDFPGRYNRPGEWRPLIYPGDASHLVAECLRLSSDPDVQGALLYIRLTGHKCIEFAVRANMELPGEFTGTVSGDVLMHKCPPDGDSAHVNVRTYDCTMLLKSGTPEEIQDSLSSIGWLMSGMFFPYGATYSWRHKYRMNLGGSGLLSPTHEDMKIVDRLLKSFPAEQDGFVLGRGIDWYNMGNSTTNPFTRFLCYYVGFETVAVGIFDGANLGVSPPSRLSRAERRSKASACIQELQLKMLDKDPIAFVREAYFDCVVSLKTKSKTVAAQVFGEGHEYLRLLFEKSGEDNVSLSELRSELAHGGVTQLDKAHERLIRNNLHKMGSITREFLLRVLFRLEPSDTVPEWSGQFHLGMSTADPRSTMWTTSEKIFPQGTTWKIRPEWCE